MIIVGAIALLVSFSILNFSSLTVLGFLLGVVFIALYFILPHLIIIPLLILRSSLDIFSGVNILKGQLSFNIPAISGLVIIGTGLFYLISQKSLGRVLSNKVARNFLFWIGTLMFWVYIAWDNFGVSGFSLAFREWSRLFTLLIVYCLMFALTDRLNYKKILSLTFWALAIPLVISYYQLVTGKGLNIEGVNRIYGTFAHPNSFGTFLVLFIALTHWKIKWSDKKTFWVALIILEFIAMVNVFAFGVILMFIGATIVFVMLNSQKRHLILIVGIIMVTVIVFSATKSGRRRIAEIKEGVDIQSTIKGRSIANTWEWRIYRSFILLEKWQQKPLLGYGLNTSPNMALTTEQVDEPHNDIVRFLFETGFVGLPFYLIFLFSIGTQLWRVYRDLKQKDRLLASLASILLSVFFAWLIAGLLGNPMKETAFQYYFWAVFGMLMGSYNQLKKKLY